MKLRVLRFLDAAVEYAIYGVIFFIPISITMIGTFAGMAIVFFLIKKILSPNFTSIKANKLLFLFLLLFFVFMGLSLFNSGQLRRQTISMRVRENRTKTLYALSRELSKSSYPDELFKIALSHIEDFFKCRAVIFVPDKNKRLEARFGEAVQLAVDSNEIAVEQWVYEHKKSAGKDTDTLPGSSGMYLPFTGAEKTVGVLGVFQTQDKQFVDLEQLHILEMFVNQTALAVEGAQLAAAALDAESKIENERLRNLILTTFSSGLTEPLTSISKTASELLKLENIKDDSKRTALIGKMRQEVERLNALIVELPQILETKE